MKVIDLLNKIANGEELPLVINIKGYKYRKVNGQFWCDETERYMIEDCTSINNLNDEVEIIEEDKKIEEIERLNNIIKHTDSWIDRTIEIIKQQPSEDDTWILERLNGIKQCLKG